MSLFYMYFWYCFLVCSSGFSFLQFSAITKLNETNYKQRVKSLMMNLIIMKLKLTFKVEAPPKSTAESSANKKKFYENCEYSNNCCLMIMENHTEESIYASIPKIKNAKEFLDAISKKYTKFSKNEKNELYYNHWVNVCFKSNVIDVSFDTCWLSSGATIHACNSMQVVISRRSPTSLEQYLYMGNGTRVRVDFMRIVRLQLSTINFLELQVVTYIYP